MTFPCKYLSFTELFLSFTGSPCPKQRSSSNLQGTFWKAVLGSGKRRPFFLPPIPGQGLPSQEPTEPESSLPNLRLGAGPRKVGSRSGGPSPPTPLWQDGQGGTSPVEQAAEEAQALDSNASASMTHPVGLGKSLDHLGCPACRVSRT